MNSSSGTDRADSTIGSASRDRPRSPQYQASSTRGSTRSQDLTRLGPVVFAARAGATAPGTHQTRASCAPTGWPQPGLTRPLHATAAQVSGELPRAPDSGSPGPGPRGGGGGGQLSLLAGILNETDRAVLELARGPGLAARVAAQAQRLLGISPTPYSSCSAGCWTGPKPPTPNLSCRRAAGGARPTRPVASQTVATEPADRR